MTESSSDTLPRAGLLRRLAALLYDSFLVAAVWMILGFILQIIAGPDTNQLIDGQVQTDPLLSNILFILMTASAAGFYIWFWTQSGQTLGMIAWKMKAEDLDGNLMTLKQGLIRFFAAWPSFFLLGIGFLWIYVDKNGDAIHDKLSSTKVVIVPKSHKPFE
ncbi:MAG: RDD family protein [Gammaproteobacteria bacterium]|nr:RDD family protein [Gammaproteobacteria bacterium]MBT3860004.1 RDD family protein [Gammaproteobacteria bacterium]MBT3987046.1 RDD family protein [Gammaproteobacteria bacterium]MBT4256100.1 RDD family protein [Gammaproteobacteria bacterium]MBT4580689.1 RDD family protein [Gammaproteobacteria bacterium]